MLFSLQLAALRLMLAAKKPLYRLVRVPRPVLLVGRGSTGRLCELVGGSGAKRTLIVTDAVLVKLGLAGTVRAGLEAQGIEVAVFDGMDHFFDLVSRFLRNEGCGGPEQHNAA